MENRSEAMIEKLLQLKEPQTNISYLQKYNVRYLVSILDRNKIELIEKIYKSKEDGFSLLEFIRFFLNVLDHTEVQTLYLTIALIDLFQEISRSLKNKQKLHFVDITNFICNKILEKRKEENQIESKHVMDLKTVEPNSKMKEYLINPPKIYGSKDEIVYKLSGSKIKVDKNKHHSVVTTSFFSHTLNKVFTLDALSDSISVYNTNCSLIKKIKPSFSKLKKDIVVLSFAYSQRQQRIGAVLKDFTILFWENLDNFQFEKSISTASHCQQCQTFIWFFQHFNAWVTSDKTGVLYIWDLEKQIPLRTIKLAYQTKINDLCVIPSINLLAVVQERTIDNIVLQIKQTNTNKSLGSKKKEEKEKRGSAQLNDPGAINLYDFQKGDIATRIKLSYQSRIPHTIQYSETYEVLLSTGYEKTITVYTLNKRFVDFSHKGQLTGHQSLITCFTMLKNSPMIVSADDKGIVKIWDIRNYKCAQTLDFKDKTNITRLLDMLDIGKIGVIGSRINFVEFDQKNQIQKKKQQKINDKLVPLCIEIDYEDQIFMVLTKKDIRIYDLHKGILKNVYCQFHHEQFQITFFKYIEGLKKFLIGTEKGDVQVYCMRTGELQAHLQGHQGSVTHIEFDQYNKIFISMGQDSSIKIQKQLNKKNEGQIQIEVKDCEMSAGRSRITTEISREEQNVKIDQKYKSKEGGVEGNGKNEDGMILRIVKNNFYNNQLSVVAISIYHGFLAIASSAFIPHLNYKAIYIWDYQFCKLLIEIKLPHEMQVTCMSFINGYSILVVGTSQGIVYFLKINQLHTSFSYPPNIQIESLENQSEKCNSHNEQANNKKGQFKPQINISSSNVNLNYQVKLIAQYQYQEVDEKGNLKVENKQKEKQKQREKQRQREREREEEEREKQRQKEIRRKQKEKSYSQSAYSINRLKIKKQHSKNQRKKKCGSTFTDEKQKKMINEQKKEEEEEKHEPKVYPSVTALNIDMLIKGFSQETEKLITLKIHVAFNNGTVSVINLHPLLKDSTKEPSAVYKQGFNPQRQLRQNFTTEISKKKFHSLTIFQHNFGGGLTIFSYVENIYHNYLKSIREVEKQDQTFLTTTYHVQKKKKQEIEITNSPICRYRHNSTALIRVFKAHIASISYLQILEHNQRYLFTAAHDGRIKLWKQKELSNIQNFYNSEWVLHCDLSINLPLPFQWNLVVSDSQKYKNKIMFGLKIIQEIFIRYGNDISINQTKVLKIKKLLDIAHLRDRNQSKRSTDSSEDRNSLQLLSKFMEEEEEQRFKKSRFHNYVEESNYQKDSSYSREEGLKAMNFATEQQNLQKKYEEEKEKENDEAFKNLNVFLFQGEFTKKDLHYEYIKKFNFSQIAGPSLRQIQIQKKLNNIQKEWKLNSDKVQEDKLKLLSQIRSKAAKNEQKQQILQFLEPKKFYKNSIDSNSYNSRLPPPSSAPEGYIRNSLSKQKTFVSNLMNTIETKFINKKQSKAKHDNNKNAFTVSEGVSHYFLKPPSKIKKDSQNTTTLTNFNTIKQQKSYAGKKILKQSSIYGENLLLKEENQQKSASQVKDRFVKTLLTRQSLSQEKKLRRTLLYGVQQRKQKERTKTQQNQSQEMKTNRSFKKNQPSKTFQQYFQEKEEMKKYQDIQLSKMDKIKNEESQCSSQVTNQFRNPNFRNIIKCMNERIKLSKKKKFSTSKYRQNLTQNSLEKQNSLSFDQFK